MSKIKIEIKSEKVTLSRQLFWQVIKLIRSNPVSFWQIERAKQKTINCMHTRFLTVPGLASSGPRHWQSIWEEQYPDLFKRVHQHNWDWPVRDEWVAKLQEEVRSLEEPVILVAHSLGCMTVAQWAQDYSSPMIEGALLVAPADAEVSKRLSFVIGFNPIPANTLPFKSVVVASTNDIYASIGRSQKFAESWGSEFINLGKKGHINAVSGLGDWEDGKRILERLSNTKFVGVQ